MPNITGKSPAAVHEGEHYTDVAGAFYLIKENIESKQSGGSYNLTDNKIHFDASFSNPIYGSSNTVQPPAINLIPQIRF